MPTGVQCPSPILETAVCLMGPSPAHPQCKHSLSLLGQIWRTRPVAAAGSPLEDLPSHGPGRFLCTACSTVLPSAYPLVSQEILPPLATLCSPPPLWGFRCGYPIRQSACLEATKGLQCSPVGEGIFRHRHGAWHLSRRAIGCCRWCPTHFVSERVVWA